MGRRIGFVLAIGAVILLLGGAAMAQDEAVKSSSTADKASLSYWFLWGGDWIAYILMVLSVVSTAFIIQYFLTIRRSVIIPDGSKARIQEMLEAKQYRELLAYTAEDPTLLSYIVGKALREAPFGFGAMERAMENAMAERVSSINLKPEILNILGNTGPLIGLYGTVMGIILAFRQIMLKGGIPEPGDLAASIGVALVATFWGLTVAIPSLVVYAMMKNRIEVYATETMSLGREYLASFRNNTAPKKKSETESPKVPVA